MKIQFCCGSNHLDGFDNRDAETDISRPLPFPEDCADFCYVSHGAEHIGTHDCLRFFQEVFRILKTGGTFRVVVPTLEKITDRQHARDLILLHGHLQLFSKESLRDMLWAAGFEREKIQGTPKDPNMDWHGRAIGEERDNQESIWVNAIK